MRNISTSLNRVWCSVMFRKYQNLIKIISYFHSAVASCIPKILPLQPLRSDGPVLEWTDRHQCSSAPRTFLKEYCAMRVWLITQMVFRRWIISARHSDNLSVRFMFMQEKQEGNDLAAQWLNGGLVYGKKVWKSDRLFSSLLWLRLTNLGGKCFKLHN